MTQEDKQLLLKDLCARLPYGVKVCIKLPNNQEKTFEEQIGDLKELTIYGGYLVNSKGIDYRSFNLDIKPYLRPMSSMTEEEIKTYQSLQDIACSYHYEFGDIVDDFSYFDNDGSLDYLNSIHIDYRGLIEKGLAIAVTEENNPYK